MHLLRIYQMEIIKIFGILCFVLGFFSLILKYRSLRMKRSLLFLEFGAGLILIADYFTYIFNGNTTSVGYWGVRISNFLTFFLVDFELYACNSYLISLLMGREKLRKVPKRIIAVFVIASIGMTVAAVAPFTGLYYTIDGFNRYQRAPMFLISFIFPVAALMTMLSVVIQYRKFMSRGVWTSVVVSAVIPLAGGIIQVLYAGFDIINISIGITSVMVYMFSLVDQNNVLLKSANTDSMTDLPNQYGFLEAVEKAKSHHAVKNYNSLYFDIVRMGQYNRRYGTDVGDRIIIDYAAYISAHIDKDEVLSRLGGNFFIALIKKENCAAFLEMIQGIPLEFKIGGEFERISVAAVTGAFEITDNHVITEQVIGNAALALNLAKNVKKVPCVYLTRELQKELHESRQIEERIPSAIKNEEFLPYYQPKVNLETMELSGAEALARWEYDNTVVPPAKFVGLMERNGTVCRLDFYILDHVCRDIKEWIKLGITPPRISVNFSRKNLGNPILAEEIYNVVKKHDIPLELIQIEITETIDEFPLDYLKGVVEALQRYGLSVAIDDFGTGSSSINLLREISFDVLKIDKQFVECKSEKDCKLLEHIIEMAEAIDSQIIAEGIENPDQLEMLKNYGCNEIQGFIFDRPLKKNAFEERIVNPKYTVKS